MVKPGYIADILLSQVPLPLAQRAMAALSRRYLTTKVQVVEPSFMLSVTDDVRPSDWLLQFAVEAITFASKHNLRDLAAKHAKLSESRFYDPFPGEHYRLLSAFTAILAPQTIVEIGTYTGMSAACFLHSMRPESKLFTFDLVPWNDFETHLDPADFRTGRIVQHIADVSRPGVFDEYRHLFETADLIFCDAPKDVAFESALVRNLSNMTPKRSCLLVFDDIRYLNMIDIWRSVASPKLDLTSFGHWTGTGLIDMREGLKLK
jgi:predicted O-methyltransferase YrrM